MGLQKIGLFFSNGLVKPKIIALHSYFILLLILLYFSQDKADRFGTFLMYISTLVLVLHVWLGAYYIVKHLKAPENMINYALDALILAILTTAVLFFHDLVIWAALLALMFLLMAFKYRLISSSTKDKKVMNYSTKKLIYESPIAPLSISLAVLAYFFKDNDLALIFLQVSALVFNILFALWIIFIKKVYDIFS